MGYHKELVTRKAEEVENYLVELDDPDRSLDRFYNICDFIMKNGDMMFESTEIITDQYKKYCLELNKEVLNNESKTQ